MVIVQILIFLVHHPWRSVSEKNHKDEETADKFMAKMLGQKLKKGYVQK